MSDVKTRQFIAAVQAHFSPVTRNTPYLFRTNVSNIWERFVLALPENMRAEWNCNCCRRFVQQYGSLAVLFEDTVIPAMWPADVTKIPEVFRDAVKCMHDAVKSASVIGMFHSRMETWGSPSYGDSDYWHHLHVRPRYGLLCTHASPGATSAEKLEEFKMLDRALAEFTPETVQTAMAILQGAYRAERVMPLLVGFANLQASLRGTKNRNARLWQAVASAPAGFCHVRGSVLGTLLLDIVEGRSVAECKARFEQKLDPTVYQRAQVAPGTGNVKQAEQTIASLGLEASLRRRFARLSDIPLSGVLWCKSASKPKEGIFAGVATKAKPVTTLEIPGERTMTWDKFSREVLPDVLEMEALAPAGREVALVTAADPDSRPILQWDSETVRNPVSWAYASGIDAEIKRRVEAAGGKHADCEIRVSLIWNDRADLDLGVKTPRGHTIYYGDKRSACGGWLDVDMNVRGETTTPVENIQWSNAPSGAYEVRVANYTPRGGTSPFRVEVAIRGQVWHFSGQNAPHGSVNSGGMIICRFEYDRVSGKVTGLPAAVAATSWQKVSAVVKSPNLWGDTPLPRHGQHTLFLLEGAKPVAGMRGLLTEMLRPELRPVRRTLEAYFSTATVEGADTADACGVGMNDATPWSLKLRVKTANAVSTYLIDRKD